MKEICIWQYEFSEQFEFIVNDNKNEASLGTYTSSSEIKGNVNWMNNEYQIIYIEFNIYEFKQTDHL